MATPKSPPALLTAVGEGNLEEAKRLLALPEVAIDECNHLGWTALHMASLHGYTDIVMLLLEKGADSNRTDKCRIVPLHLSCIGEHADIVRLLLKCKTIDVNIQIAELLLGGGGGLGLLGGGLLGLLGGGLLELEGGLGGLLGGGGLGLLEGGLEVLLLGLGLGGLEVLRGRREEGFREFRKLEGELFEREALERLPGATPLHIACSTNSLDVVQQLLSAPGIDMNIKDAKGRTPVMMTSDFLILALLNKYMTSCDDFPVHTVSKVVLCGNTGAGKSTLAQIISSSIRTQTSGSYLELGPWTWLKRALKAHEDPLRKVKPLTAGILSYYVPHSDGSIMLYDLAGHLEYYSSHSSCLEGLAQSTPSTFLTLADISAELEDVKTQLSYWCALIGNVCSKCPQPSEVIVIGTHADKVKDKAELGARFSLLQRHADEVVKKTGQHFAGFIGLNVTDYQSADMISFIRQLLETNEVVRKRCPPISLKCHVLYSLLNEKVPSDKVAITLSYLLQLLGTVQDHGLSTNESEITSYLTTLSDKGLISFFPNANPSDSWIVLKSDVLLEKVNGTLFAPASFKEFRHCLVSNTGIIPTSELQNMFPEYDIKMIVQFLFHRELGQPVVDTTDTSKTLSDCVFFPYLISATQPSDVIIRPSSFVWQMHTSSGSEFFTPRCHHALMHRLANQFTLPSEKFKHGKEIHCFSRRCEVWSRGITWLDEFGIRFVVEMDQSFECLSFAISAENNKKNPQYPKQHKRVLKVIKKCCKDFCPSVAKNMKEHIRCPSLPCLGPSMAEVELPLLRKAVSSISPESYTLADISRNKVIDLNEWLQMEPQLPLLIGVSMKEGTPSTSSVPELKVLMDAVAAKIPAKWRLLGIQLGVPVAVLDDIHSQVAGRPESNIHAFEQMLGKWKSLSPLTYTWSTIISALEAPSVGAMDVAAELRLALDL